MYGGIGVVVRTTVCEAVSVGSFPICHPVAVAQLVEHQIVSLTVASSSLVSHP